MTKFTCDTRYPLSECRWIPSSSMSHGGDEMRAEFVNAAIKEGRKKELGLEIVPVLLKEAADYGFTSFMP